ncbi:hypothetical protein [Oerskovia paurometabola]|uniref:Uncharacterized protein n=1 Tax=Oerskovia paurometabola TaxID=162170 RepID=A0ABW1X813_9CELL|nr:hypothetical protein [Oerskovia paurometabola]MBM7497795.1 hypothetical protein [Oerskovia paurometabola]
MVSRLRDRVVAFLQDRPRGVTVSLILLVAAHAVLAHFLPSLDFWDALREPSESSVQNTVTIYLSLSGASALAAGFAGVVIVFGLGSTSVKFLTFRVRAGRSLRRNWTSVIGSSFAAAGGATVAALLAVSGELWIAAWVFELGLVLVIHPVIRMVWLLWVLMGVVESDDAVVISAQNRVPLDDLFGAD